MPPSMLLPEFVHLCNCFILPGNATWDPVSFPESSCCHLLSECAEFAPTRKKFRIIALYSQVFLSLYWVCYDPASVLRSVFWARRQVGPWLPNQGSNLQPLPWEGESWPLPCQRSPCFHFLCRMSPPCVLYVTHCVSVMPQNRKAER